MCDDDIDGSRRRVLRTLCLIGGTVLTARAVASGDEGAEFMQEAVRMKALAIERGDQPYGAVIVRDGQIVGRGASAVIRQNDPTAHAEMLAIRDACRRLATRDLSGCVMYGTSRACPMCETAAYWARIARLRFGDDLTSGGAPGFPRC
jgi:tRNA(Arg) A34 adenosine deaminase TadA